MRSLGKTLNKAVLSLLSLEAFRLIRLQAYHVGSTVPRGERQALRASVVNISFGKAGVSAALKRRRIPFAFGANYGPSRTRFRGKLQKKRVAQ